MEQRTLGTTPLVVSALALGCMGMSQGYGPRDEDTSIATIHRALDAGITLLDTATTYGLGHNEALVGRALAGGRRDQAVVATKFGITRNESGHTGTGVDGSPANAVAVCDRSLSRLGVDHLDLFYLHRVDPDVPVEESIGAMAGLVAAGKVGHLGISEATAADLERAVATHPIAALQSEWSLWCRDLEDDILPTARRLGVSVLPYSPLGRGFLAGAAPGPAALAPGDWRAGDERFAGDHATRNLALLERFTAVATDLGATPAQLAIAWLLAQGDDVVPVVGMTRPNRVDENAAAVDLHLAPADVARIEAVVPREAWSGASPSFRRAGAATAS
jgi:aryl-alcohol dehydrogenase-like predicted oxidoreductase